LVWKYTYVGTIWQPCSLLQIASPKPKSHHRCRNRLRVDEASRSALHRRWSWVTTVGSKISKLSNYAIKEFFDDPSADPSNDVYDNGFIVLHRYHLI
jgi:hypothetical protein